MPKTLNFKYFKIEEFASPDDPKSGDKMNYIFLEYFYSLLKLYFLRFWFGQ